MKKQGKTSDRFGKEIVKKSKIRAKAMFNIRSESTQIVHWLIGQGLSYLSASIDQTGKEWLRHFEMSNKCTKTIQAHQTILFHTTTIVLLGSENFKDWILNIRPWYEVSIKIYGIVTAILFQMMKDSFNCTGLRTTYRRAGTQIKNTGIVGQTSRVKPKSLKLTEKIGGEELRVRWNHMTKTQPAQ